MLTMCFFSIIDVKPLADFNMDEIVDLLNHDVKPLEDFNMDEIADLLNHVDLKDKPLKKRSPLSGVQKKRLNHLISKIGRVQKRLKAKYELM